MSFARAAMTSALFLPSVECSATSWRLRFERLRRVRTDAADTEHGDGRAAQFFEVFFPDKGKLARIL